MNETVFTNCLLLHHCEGYYKTDAAEVTTLKEITPMEKWLKCVNKVIQKSKVKIETAVA
ncbi:MAG: hypothetical protein ABW007_07120 [Chitinophagaceae bacterium]